MPTKYLRLIALLLLIAVPTILLFSPLREMINLTYAKGHLDQWRQWTQVNLALSAGIFFIAYLVVSAFAIPGAMILTLLGGALYGFAFGTLLVSFASSIGALCALLIARYLARDFIHKKFAKALAVIDRGLEEEGTYYLMALRLMPVFPFFIVNYSLGLTNIGIKQFYVWSQLGMLPATLIYVNAGRELAKIEQLSDLASPSLLIGLSLLGVGPLAFKHGLAAWRRRHP